MKMWIPLLFVLGLFTLAACSGGESRPSQPTQIIVEQTATPVLTATNLLDQVTSTPTPNQAVIITTPTPIPPTPESKIAQWEPQRPVKTCVVSDSRTCAILYVLADQYDDEHVLKTRPHFEQAGYTTFVTSDTLEEINGFHECYDFTPAYPDFLLEDVNVGDFDAILCGGSDGIFTKLHGNLEAHRIAQDAASQGKVVGAIGDGPVVLAKAGLLEGRTVTVLTNDVLYGITDQWSNAIRRNGGIYSELSPVRDNLLVTSGKATVDFAWGVIELMGEQD
jgi:putative intracellular protease/amidase